MTAGKIEALEVAIHHTSDPGIMSIFLANYTMRRSIPGGFYGGSKETGSGMCSLSIV